MLRHAASSIAPRSDTDENDPPLEIREHAKIILEETTEQRIDGQVSIV